MPAGKIHLVCNAHLDPVWLWEWQEGAGEALSTFRTAAEFCEKHKGFIFCHNEAVLYRWVEEYEPALFRRIQGLVKRKKWHIMGGWHVQPDCNMPSGESFVRQILLGKRYFLDKFGVEPRTAVNLDPFGHSRGLVQILARSGYEAYLCCRPAQAQLPLSRDEFVWVGFEGSEVLANRASAHYCSIGGKAAERLKGWLKANPNADLALLLWGIGNHGGGASREDLKDIEALKRERQDFEIIHSTPDAYFGELEARRDSLPCVERDLNPWAVGCYTTMARVKQKHRRLENELFSAEKMAAVAWMEGLLPYPGAELRQAVEDMALAEFHDILPGSSIPAAEDGAIQLLYHGLEILSRVKARTFFALAAGERPAQEGEIPIFIYNPHPFKVAGLIECEFEPREPNYDRTKSWIPALTWKGKPVPCQTEKEQSNLSIEWRKRIVFEAVLPPARLSRFSCRLETRDGKPRPPAQPESGPIRFLTPDLQVEISTKTGLVDIFRVSGRDVLGSGAFHPLVMEDDADPWGMKVTGFRKPAGRFELASPEEGSLFSGIRGSIIPSVRVIEDGDVRTVVESVFAYGDSRMGLRYNLPKRGTEVEVEAVVIWAEKDRMLKLSLPCLLPSPRFMGQTVYGVYELPSNGEEAVSQKWLALVSADSGTALTVINDCLYGSDFRDGELRLSLLRSPAYSADTWEAKLQVAEDRFIPRQDQGERMFRLWINAGPAEERMERIDREALARNEKPYVLAYFPPGAGKTARPGATLSDGVIQVTALKKAEDGDDLVIRLFEPTGKPRTAVLSLPCAGAKTKVRLKGFEIRTLRLNPRTKKFREADLLERPFKTRP